MDLEPEVKRLFKLSEWDNYRFGDTDLFHEFTEPEQTFHLVWRTEAEVNNGGFDQFFQNSSGGLAAVTAAAFRRIGADTDWSDDEARRERLNALDEEAQEKLSALDQEFYDYPDGDLADLLYPYVYANRSQIGVPESFWTA